VGKYFDRASAQAKQTFCLPYETKNQKKPDRLTKPVRFFHESQFRACF